MLSLRLSLHWFKVMRLQMGHWLTDGRSSSDSLSSLFRIVFVLCAMSLRAIVTSSLRNWLVEYLRFFIENPAVVRVFLHVLEEGDTVFNLGLHMVKLPRLRPMLRSSLVVMVCKSQLVLVFYTTDVASVIILRSLDSVSDCLTVAFDLFARGRSLLDILVVFERLLLEPTPAHTFLRRAVRHSTASAHSPARCSHIVFHLILVAMLGLLLVRTSA